MMKWVTRLIYFLSIPMQTTNNVDIVPNPIGII